MIQTERRPPSMGHR